MYQASDAYTHRCRHTEGFCTNTRGEEYKNELSVYMCTLSVIHMTRCVCMLASLRGVCSEWTRSYCERYAWGNHSFICTNYIQICTPLLTCVHCIIYETTDKSGKNKRIPTSLCRVPSVAYCSASIGK